MFFTQEDFRKIENWLKTHSIRDTEFNKAFSTTTSDKVAIIQNGKNVLVPISKLPVGNIKISNDGYFIVDGNKTNIKAGYAAKVKMGNDGKMYASYDDGDTWEPVSDTLTLDGIRPDDLDIGSYKDGETLVLKLKDRVGIQGQNTIYLKPTSVKDDTTGEYITNYIIPAKDLQKDNTIYIIRYDFDLNNQDIILGQNSSLVFEGGSFKNGRITVNLSTSIFSYYDNRACFDYNTIQIKGQYTKAIPLSLIGICADGKDKSDILCKLNDIFVASPTTPGGSDQNYYLRNFTITGTIKCSKNKIQLPARCRLSGIGAAQITFTADAEGENDYCLALNSRVVLRNIRFLHNNPKYTGTIIYACPNLLTDTKGDHIGIAHSKIIDCDIEQTYTDDRCYRGTGIKFDLKYDGLKGVHFTDIQLANVRIDYVSIGIDVLIDNRGCTKAKSDCKAWGNSIYADALFISSNRCGIRFENLVSTSENAANGDVGFCNFSGYEHQAINEPGYEGPAGFDIGHCDGCINFLYFDAWDSDKFGIVRNGGKVRIVSDRETGRRLNQFEKVDTSGNTYLQVSFESSSSYKYILYGSKTTDPDGPNTQLYRGSYRYPSLDTDPITISDAEKQTQALVIKNINMPVLLNQNLPISVVDVAKEEITEKLKEQGKTDVQIAQELPGLLDSAIKYSFVALGKVVNFNKIVANNELVKVALYYYGADTGKDPETKEPIKKDTIHNLTYKEETVQEEQPDGSFKTVIKGYYSVGNPQMLYEAIIEADGTFKTRGMDTVYGLIVVGS